ncbi:hypothetical protein Q7320_02650 [Glaesserella parasuis]|nr:hypothetical protein [Glaesserella parasuis]MDP0130175.1 hypothetical protein [Glaesserella parasuis]MDP0151402.1 hypothetical protein [Glaesserella parasuis]MDP0153484.1 hypothetical protein [Glaesserella parasuis]MDP0157812.1 hypothetical protein [Glaesserella parasuis]
MSNYIHTPKTISYNDIVKRDFSLSSSRHKKFEIANQNCKLVKEFSTRTLSRKDLGVEVGSANYIGQSSHYFLRTKALQDHSYLLEITPETVLPIMPSSFVKMNLKAGDLIISKDSNIGEIVILDKDYPNVMLSGALYKLPVSQYKYYLLAMMKHAIFREQLDFIVPKGATIRHAKTLFLDCEIPMPNENAENVIQFVENLTQAIVNKQRLIKQRHQEILALIEKELLDNQKDNTFSYNYPSISYIQENGRMDATFYSEYYKKLMFPVLNYGYGYAPLTEQGLELKPGPSLEIKLLETRIDSDFFIKGFYRLITPKQILNTGVIDKERFIGTPKKIPTIKFGDILFGESGTGRTMVYLDNCNNTINNAHAHILRPIKGKCTLDKAITIRSIMQYYKEKGITDCLTVGGNGGHLSPSYFNRVFIPNFPTEKQQQIAKLYHNPTTYDVKNATLDNFITLDDEFNNQAGIYELDKTAKILQNILNQTIENIINDNSIKIEFNIR